MIDPHLGTTDALDAYAGGEDVHRERSKRSGQVVGAVGPAPAIRSVASIALGSGAHDPDSNVCPNQRRTTVRIRRFRRGASRSIRADFVGIAGVDETPYDRFSRARDEEKVAGKSMDIGSCGGTRFFVGEIDGSAIEDAEEIEGRRAREGASCDAA
jgi:hypothetical protein